MHLPICECTSISVWFSSAGALFPLNRELTPHCHLSDVARSCCGGGGVMVRFAPRNSKQPPSPSICATPQLPSDDDDGDDTQSSRYLLDAIEPCIRLVRSPGQRCLSRRRETRARALPKLFRRRGMAPIVKHLK